MLRIAAFLLAGVGGEVPEVEQVAGDRLLLRRRRAACRRRPGPWPTRRAVAAPRDALQLAAVGLDDRERGFEDAQRAVAHRGVGRRRGDKPARMHRQQPARRLELLPLVAQPRAVQQQLRLDEPLRAAPQGLLLDVGRQRLVAAVGGPDRAASMQSWARLSGASQPKTPRHSVCQASSGHSGR